LIVNGSTGSGKSLCSLKLAEQISESQGTNFNVSDNVSFTFESMLRKMTLEQNDKPGTCYVFEEVGSVGSGSSAKEWQSSANKLFSSFMQTSRCLRQVLIMNTPSFSFLDNSSRKMVHVQLVMKSINFKRKISYAKPYLVSSDAREDKLYFKYLRFPHEGRMLKLTIQSFELPSEAVMVSYDAEKTKFVRELNQSILKEFEDRKNKKENKAQENEELEKQKEQMVVMQNQGMSSIEIAVRLGCSQRKVQYYLKEKELQREMAQELPIFNKKQGTGWVLDAMKPKNTTY
jgi:hypothetical protein